VKTTTRKEFMVQPAKGFIPPMSTLIVRIGLQPGAAATKGKFQVQPFFCSFLGYVLNASH